MSTEVSAGDSFLCPVCQKILPRHHQAVRWCDGVGAPPPIGGDDVGVLTAEERASMFIDWCALHDFGVDANGWPDGAYQQLVEHIRASEKPFALTRH